MLRYIRLFHLYVTAFVAPMFLLVAISGGLYLVGVKGETTKTPVDLPADAMLDFASDDLKGDVSALLAAQGIDHRFDYVRGGATSLVTRPTSRVNYEIKLDDQKLVANRVQPDLQKRMIELHKGHGPVLFKTYQQLVAVSLFLIVLSGLWMGLNSKMHRQNAAVTAGAGLLFFVILAFFS